MTGQEMIRVLVSILYGGYNVYRSIIQLKDKKWPLAEYMMIVGGVLLAVVSFAPNAALFVILPLTFMQLAAILRDKRQNEVDLATHAFRMLISVLIIMIYFFIAV